MIDHFTCRDCRQPQTCEDVLKLFAGNHLHSNISGQRYCAACITRLVLPEAEGDLFADLVCYQCGGTARWRVEDFSAEHPALLHDSRIVSTRRAEREMILQVLSSDLNRYWLPYVIPGAPGTTPASNITIAPGQLRCMCNLCERLTVLG